MAGFDPQILTGGTQPTLTTAPKSKGRPAAWTGGAVQPHHGLVGIVLLAVLVLFLLDKAGFRFAVTVGKR